MRTTAFMFLVLVFVVIMVVVLSYPIGHDTTASKQPLTPAPTTTQTRNPNAILWEIDSCLNSLEKGEACPGSFSDWFVPQVLEAKEAGASKKEVSLRIDRIWSLAEKGKFVSGYEAELFQNGQLKRYLDFLKK